VQAHVYGKVAFLSNTADDGSPCVATFLKRSYNLPPHTVLLVDTEDGHVAFNSSDLPVPTPEPPPTSSSESMWEYWQELSGGEGWAYHASSIAKPLELLDLTGDDTDYAWYSTNVSAALLAKHTPPQIDLTGETGTMLYAFLDGIPLSPPLSPPLSTPLSTPLSPVGNASSVELGLFAVAMGIPNGGDSPAMSKGLHSVRVNGVELTRGAEQADRVWLHSWIMRGESESIFTAEGTDRVPWRAVPSTGGVDALPHVWFRSYIDMPLGSPFASQTSYALNLTRMNKGVAYLNGFNLGRYWLVSGKCSGECAP